MRPIHAPFLQRNSAGWAISKTQEYERYFSCCGILTLVVAGLAAVTVGLYACGKLRSRHIVLMQLPLVGGQLLHACPLGRVSRHIDVAVWEQIRLFDPLSPGGRDIHSESVRQAVATGDPLAKVIEERWNMWMVPGSKNGFDAQAILPHSRDAINQLFDDLKESLITASSMIVRLRNPKIVDKPSFCELLRRSLRSIIEIEDLLNKDQPIMQITRLSMTDVADVPKWGNPIQADLSTWQAVRSSYTAACSI